MNSFSNILSSIPWFAWIPIVAIVMGGIIKIVAMGHDHAERVEMIRAGMRPDTKSLARDAVEDN